MKMINALLASKKGMPGRLNTCAIFILLQNPFGMVEKRVVFHRSSGYGYVHNLTGTFLRVKTFAAVKIKFPPSQRSLALI